MIRRKSQTHMLTPLRSGSSRFALELNRFGHIRFTGRAKTPEQGFRRRRRHGNSTRKVRCWRRWCTFVGAENAWHLYGWRANRCALRYSSTLCSLLIKAEDFLWGVVDIVPSEKTDFPDTRNKSAIHSANGSCMIIPREGDKIRVYIQLSDTDAVDPTTGRIDLARYGPERLLEVAKTTFKPYTIDAVSDKIEWWTIYQSKETLLLF